jgi:hypothetical protein
MTAKIQSSGGRPELWHPMPFRQLRGCRVVAELPRNQMSPWHAPLAIVNGRLVGATGPTESSYVRVR